MSHESFIHSLNNGWLNRFFPRFEEIRRGLELGTCLSSVISDRRMSLSFVYFNDFSFSSYVWQFLFNPMIKKLFVKLSFHSEVINGF